MSIGLMDSARRVRLANICMFIKKRRYLHANILHKKDFVRKEINASTDTYLQTAYRLILWELQLAES